jgi:hypothetical protein
MHAMTGQISLLGHPLAAGLVGNPTPRLAMIAYKQVSHSVAKLSMQVLKATRYIFKIGYHLSLKLIVTNKFGTADFDQRGSVKREKAYHRKVFCVICLVYQEECARFSGIVL